MNAVTKDRVARNIRTAFNAAHEVEVERHFGSMYAVEHVLVTFWADDRQDSWATVEIIPFMSRVRVVIEQLAGAAPVPNYVIEAAKAAARAISVDVGTALDVLQGNYEVSFYTAGEDGHEQCLTDDNEIEKWRATSATFLEGEHIAFENSIERSER